jgi:DNA-binding response OmpR family regulator
MCVEVAEKNPPDIILLDILMPRVNGWEVLGKLKKNDKTKNIPVLIFSNLAQADEIQKGLDLGADEYLVKSNLTPKELLVKIEKSLK